MLSFVAILINNFIFAPYVQAFGGVSVMLEIPPDMWDLLKIGIGGYIGVRSVEKTVERLTEKRKPEKETEK